MVNLVDIVRQAQSGAAIDNLSRQFGLDGDQTMRAVEALLPAFTLGFQKAAQNPVLFGQILEMMSSGRFAPFFDGFAGAGAGTSGQQVLEKLFGSPDVSRQIATQTSAMTGVATQVLQQMMPLIAAMLMGGLFRFTSVEGLSELLRRWADWLQGLKPLAPGERRSAGRAPSPYEAWTEMMGGLLALPRKPEPPAPTDPWKSFADAVFGKPNPPPPPPPSQAHPFDALTQMFETGRQVQAQHLANLQSIFAGMWPGAGSR